MNEDTYQCVTDQIIKALEEGVDRYLAPWHCIRVEALYPVNVLSKKPYRGINVVSLWAQSLVHKYQTGLWATYRQWKELGAQVRRSEKATTVVFWSTSDRATESPEPDENKEVGRKRAGPIARSYHVFNASQVDGFTEDSSASPALPDRIERAEAFFRVLKVDIRHGGIQSFYCPETDHIQMPPFETFTSVEGYYATLAHEVIHWTGAVKRLGREFDQRYGSSAYVMEELVAEIGAAFICASIGLLTEPRWDNAPYIATWLSFLKNDKRAIFTAASKAQAAADWLYAKSE